MGGGFSPHQIKLYQKYWANSTILFEKQEKLRYTGGKKYREVALPSADGERRAI